MSSAKQNLCQSSDEVPEWPLLPKNGVLNSTHSINYCLLAPPQPFFGLETDMYNVLNLIPNRRFVNIVGPTGMGCSSLAATFCHYIHDCKSSLLLDDTYFVKATPKRPVGGVSSPIISLHSQLVLAGKSKALSPKTLI